MPRRPDIHLHIKRLVLDHAVVGPDRVFDAQALQAELVQQLSPVSTAAVLPRAPLVRELGQAIATRVAPLAAGTGRP